MGKIKEISSVDIIDTWCDKIDENDQIINYRSKHNKKLWSKKGVFIGYFIENCLLQYNDKNFLFSEETTFYEKIKHLILKITKKIVQNYKISDNILILMIELLENSIINNIGPHKIKKIINKFTEVYNDRSSHNEADENKLKTCTNSEVSADNDCVICLGTKKSNKIRILACKHKFHQQCIDKWLETDMKCALCRSSLKDITKYDKDTLFQFI